MENELLYNELYEKTQDCGRAQFVKLLMEKEKENRQLKNQLQQKDDIINKAREHLELKIIRYSNETNYMLDETDLKEIIQILDNKGE